MTRIMANILEAFGGWAAGGFGAGGGFFAVKWLLEFIAGRTDAREAALDQDTRFVIENLKAEVARLFDRVTTLETEVAECRQAHANAEAKVIQLLAQRQGLGEAREHAQLIVSAERVAARQQGN
ncbi:hypothetical protein ADT71_03605 [Novosphingobium sp. ST904]|nr:hypothetical protein ADT71_03605 [Novosphingobium sp. ST904]